MRTSFLDWEDKQLVRIAYEFEKEDIRITWAYVVRRMTKSKRTATELRLRLASLKRTYGKFVKDFPRCFFGGSAPERCFLSSADARHVGSSGSVAVRRKVEPSGNAVVRRQMGAVTKRSAAVMKPPSSAEMEQLGGASDSSITPAMEQLICALEPSACAVVKRPGNALETQSVSAVLELQAPPRLPATSCSSLLPLHDAIRVLASIFSNITAGDIRQDAGRTQDNAGELLPSGVAAMITALGPLNTHDIFLDQMGWGRSSL
ncbi:hypothetical protein PRNP1_012364 [Phytophthora ramorum]